MYTHVLYSLALYYAFRLFVSCVVVRQLRFIVHQNECLRLHSFRTRCIHMYFTRLRFITHLDCLSRASLFGNSALSCIKMNACGCILLERGVYTCTLFVCALLRCLRQYIAWLSGSKKDREVAVIRELPRIDFAECLRLHSFRTRCIHMYFTRLCFITHLDCLSLASLFGNSALSCIKMNACGCILLERGVYTCTLLACALLRI